MLTGLNEENKKLYAWETEKTEGPFHCSECSGELLLRKGVKKAHHFAHKPPVNCLYGAGESEVHYKIKKELYEYLSKQKNCTLCELERNLNSVRPDVSLHINNKRVAIEIQKSTIDIQTICKRMIEYNKQEIYVLWIMPTSKPDLVIHGNGDFVHNIKEWELFLHALNYGRVYYWQGESKLKAYHFSEYNIYKDVSEFYSEDGELQSYGGYSYTAKRLKKTSTNSKLLQIEKDFSFEIKKEWKSKNWTVPTCRILQDKNDKWW